MFAILSALSALAVLSVVVWAFAEHPTEPAFGQRFVVDEVPIIPWLGVYFKPVTMIVGFGFVTWAFALESLREHAETTPLVVRRLLTVLFSLVAFVFAYEVIWNLAMWSDAHILSPSVAVDLLSNDLNSSIKLPRNFTYVTKVDSLYVAISLYSVFFIRTVGRRRPEPPP